MRRLLFLPVFLALTQMAYAERWMSLISSVAALESARVASPEAPLPEHEYLAPVMDYTLPAEVPTVGAASSEVEESCATGVCPTGDEGVGGATDAQLRAAGPLTTLNSFRSNLRERRQKRVSNRRG